MTSKRSRKRLLPFFQEIPSAESNMTKVIFYEKPGCKTNARQKQALEVAGHTVEAHSLLAGELHSGRWTKEDLLSFFGDTPVAEWVHPAAVKVKSGEIIPSLLSAAEAMELLLADPILIRRPLIEALGQRCAGFTREPVPTLLGLSNDTSVDIRLDRCSHPDEPCVTPSTLAKHTAARGDDSPHAPSAPRVS